MTADKLIADVFTSVLSWRHWNSGISDHLVITSCWRYQTTPLRPSNIGSLSKNLMLLNHNNNQSKQHSMRCLLLAVNRLATARMRFYMMQAILRDLMKQKLKLQGRFWFNGINNISTTFLWCHHKTLNWWKPFGSGNLRSIRFFSIIKYKPKHWLINFDT